MSAAPVVVHTSTIQRPYSLRKEWVAVLCAMLFICCTSTTFMGARNSQIVVNSIWKLLFGNWQAAQLGHVNSALRKTGHFFGYGTVGLIFRNAWYKTAQVFSLVVKSWLNSFAGLLAVISTFIVGSLDEYHQMFTPGRVGCLRDAVWDTCGAICLNLAFWAVWARHRRQEIVNPRWEAL